MTLKLYIEDSPDPWISWDKDLFKMQHLSKGTDDDLVQFYGIEQVPTPWDADILFLNENEVNFRDPLLNDKEVFLFVPELKRSGEEELRILNVARHAESRGWTMVTESLNLYAKLLAANMTKEPWLWWRPSRVNDDYLIDHEWKSLDEIVAVFDAADPLGHAHDLIKAYLGAYMTLRDDHGIEPILRIFSHTELPFEPFNEIQFEGMVPNKKLIKAIQRAKLFIFPAETENYPNPLAEAVQLGTPSFYYWPEKTPLMRHDVFPDDKFGKYKDAEELTQKIIDHFVESKELTSVAPNNQFLAVAEETQEFGLHMFMTELARRLQVGPLQSVDPE